MEADVAKGSGTKKGVAEGVYGNVGIAVAKQTAVKWDIYAAENQWTILYKAMDIEAVSDSEHKGGIKRGRGGEEGERG